MYILIIKIILTIQTICNMFSQQRVLVFPNIFYVPAIAERLSLDKTDTEG